MRETDLGLEFLDHDAEALGAGLVLRVVEVLLDVEGDGGAVLEPDEVDGG